MIELLDPTLEAATQPIAYAARPSRLEGKRVALIENTKFNSDKLLLKIGDILVKEYGAASARMFRKHNASVPAHAIQDGDETKLRPLVESPDDILIVPAGGRAGAVSCYIPGWGSPRSSQAETKEVKR